MIVNNLRQLTRSHEWWDHKTPQVLSLAYATAITSGVPLYELLYPAFAVIFISLVFMAVYASIINDFTDLEIDIACGKSNMMEKLSLPFRFLILGSGFLLPILAISYIYHDTLATCFYICILISISLYSFSPIRLKDRGIWGIISCAAAEHLFPTIFSIAIIYYYAGTPIDYTWLIGCGVLSLCYGFRSILWHQFLDRENDLQSGVNTFASQIDPEKFVKIPRLIVGIELIALLFLLSRLNILFSWGSLFLYLIFIWQRKRQFKSIIIVVISPKTQYFQILMLDFYTIFFPVSVLLYHALTSPNGWIPLLVHLILFNKIILTMIKETLYLMRGMLKKVF